MKLRRICESDRRMRELERRAKAGDPEAWEQYLGAQWRSREARPTEFQGDPVGAQVQGLSQEPDFPSPGDLFRYQVEDIEDILNMEQFPYEAYHDYWDTGCSQCGSDQLFAMSGTTGNPRLDSDEDWDTARAGLVLRCTSCGHEAFFRPENWPPKGHQDPEGDWVWAEARSSLRGAESLHEAGMSRRSFLKLMGKAAGMAMGSPLEGLGNLFKFLPKPDQAARWLQAYKNSGIDPELVKIALFERIYDEGIIAPKETKNISTDIIRGWMVDIFSGNLRAYDIDNGVGLLRAMGPGVEEVLGNLPSQLVKGAIQAYGPEKLMRDTLIRPNRKSIWKSSIDALGDFSKYSPEISSILDQLGITSQMLEQAGPYQALRSDLFERLRDANFIDQSHVDATRQSWERRLERKRLEEEWEDQEYERRREERRKEKEAQKRRDAGGHYGREFGYEKQGMWDPRSSRPVSELGPFEARLVNKLNIVVEEK